MTDFGKTTYGRFVEAVRRGQLNTSEFYALKDAKPETELVNIDGRVIKIKHASALNDWAVLTPELEKLLHEIGF